MKIIVHPSGPLRGNLALPGDKSLSHRAVLFGAIARGHSQIANLPLSGVTNKMVEAVRSLGVDLDLKGHRLEMRSPGMVGWHAPEHPIDCGNSGTTLRLLAGALAAGGLPAILDGSPALRARPMDRILKPLQSMGVPIRGSRGDCAPLELESRSSAQRLQAIDYTLPVASAQVKSCLLLAGLATDGPVILHEPASSRDHTERMLQHMGVKVESNHYGNGSGGSIILSPPMAPLVPLRLNLPGDLSSASFLIGAALILPGSQVTLHNVGLNPGRTGLLDTLGEMGADIQVRYRGKQAGEPFGDITVRHSALKSTQISGERVVRMIDEFPVFAVVASFSRGRTLVKEAQELHYKESDRIACLCRELSSLGCQISETPDGFAVEGPSAIRSAQVHPRGDHRLAMALTIAAMAGDGPVTIENAEIIQESYPEFCSHLAQLGARLDFE